MARPAPAEQVANGGLKADHSVQQGVQNAQHQLAAVIDRVRAEAGHAEAGLPEVVAQTEPY